MRQSDRFWLYAPNDTKMEELQQPVNANERRCNVETKRGRVTRGLNAEGLCPMHAGTTDPRDLGRKSSEARRRPNPDRVHESLRVYLKREVPPGVYGRRSKQPCSAQTKGRESVPPSS